MMKIVSVILFCIILFITGCDNGKVYLDDKSEIIQSYLDVRYNAITVENFFQRVEEMSGFYSDSFKNSDDWAVNQKNLDSAYELLKQDEIYAEVLYKDVTCITEDTYEANIIVKYNTVDIQNTYCAEYIFNITFTGDKIDSFEKINTVVALVGEGNILIEDGNVIVTTEPCDEEVCAHDHTHKHS